MAFCLSGQNCGHLLGKRGRGRGIDRVGERSLLLVGLFANGAEFRTVRRRVDLYEWLGCTCCSGSSEHSESEPEGEACAGAANRGRSRHRANPTAPTMAEVRGPSIVIAMATQSLYRRYRPRRFSEVRGQDHVVKALRNSVVEGREGQAYLFSGPRGTGKTTSARILAKVLNCTNVQEGEPCCECESCLSVERGTSYDVHELDAASNNGVDAMRDLIDKASLGTPGRHKVYILDEVHMLTKPAEAALLKTLEEPPPHVVFVLATTDPQKMSDTIRSRTQHLQFHLLPADTLQQHVRWVAEDAGLVVSDAAIEQVLAQGGGSARDTLSALELVASTGGEGAETVPLGEFVESMIERDAGRALTMAAGAIGLGRDPRTLTEELIGYLRNGFLSIMAPDLVQLPSLNVSTLSDQAQRLGAAGLVRGIEQLGEALTEMRHAPDPRVLLDVAIVKLTSDAAASGDAGAALGALTARVAKLEKQIADGIPAAAAPSAASPAAAATAAPADAASPTDPKTGRAQLGGRARRSAAPTAHPLPNPRPHPLHLNPRALQPSAEPAPVAAEPAPAAQSVEPQPAPAPATPIPEPGRRACGRAASSRTDPRRPRQQPRLAVSCIGRSGKTTSSRAYAGWLVRCSPRRSMSRTPRASSRCPFRTRYTARSVNNTETRSKRR